MADDDDAWGDIFAKAEGKMDPTPVNESSKKESPRKRKRHWQDSSQQQTSTLVEYLSERTSSASALDDHWPVWMILGDSLSKSSCRAWIHETSGSSLSSSSTCQACGDSPFHHRVVCSAEAKQQWPAQLFGCLRNLRCSSKLLLLQNEQLNVRIIKEEGKLLEQICSRLLHSPEHTLLLRKCNDVRHLVPRLWRANDPTTSAGDAVRLFIACDAIYYQLYYLQITGKLPSDDQYIPHPLEYFGRSNLTLDINAAKARLQKWTSKMRRKLPEQSLQNLMARYGMEHNPRSENPLSALHYYRLLETVSVLGKADDWMNDGDLWSQVSKAHQEEHETTAPPLLCDWRDSCRDFLCHLYAYATIPNAGLNRIQQLLKQYNVRDGVVEVGAGTGYLAHLLSDRGISVAAFDICPTSKTDGNEYHGGTPSFVRVEKGNVRTLSKASIPGLDRKALLLCYPPPKSSMAYDCLRRFLDEGGSCFIHVGEFKGLTGSADFEVCLLKRFDCIERLPCLAWGTDASEVTFWLKKDPSKPTKASLLLPCSHCQKKEATKRCRLLRYLEYCNVECFKKHEPFRKEHLRMSMIDTMAMESLDFASSKHFSSL